MTYEIIQGGSIKELTERVNEKIKEGSVPIGGVAVEAKAGYVAIEMKVTRITYLQAMIHQTRVVNIL